MSIHEGRPGSTLAVTGVGVRVGLIASLTALAIVLKLRIFEIPYPPAPFLKYDVSGVPIVLIGFIDLKSIAPSTLIYYIVHVAMGADVIGMAMKCLAELSTSIPLILAYSVIKNRSRVYLSIPIATSAASRVLIMSLANYIITPHWLTWARWVKTYEDAAKITIGLMPHIALFNLTLGLIISVLSIIVLRIVEKTRLIT